MAAGVGLTAPSRVIVGKSDMPLSGSAVMEFGNKTSGGGNLLLTWDELHSQGLSESQRRMFTRRILGSDDFINGGIRHCI
jgi:hypothetical protein